MRINIFTKIMIALVVVIAIVSVTLVATSLKIANDWAAKSTLESREILKDKYKLFIESLAESLAVESEPEHVAEHMKKMTKKHPEMKEFALIQQTDNKEFIQISEEASEEKIEPMKSAEKNDQSMNSQMEEKPADDSSMKEKSEKEKKFKLTSVEANSVGSGKALIEFEKDMGSMKESGSDEVMVDKPLLKIIATIKNEDTSAPKTAIFARVSLVEPLMDIHVRHQKTSRYFVNIALMASTLSVLIALLLGGIIARGITQPVKQLMNVAEKVSMGEDTADINVKSNDEIGLLAESFQRMLTTVKILLEEDK